jgi:hypothetical protein
VAELDGLVELYLELEDLVFRLREKYNGADNAEEDLCLEIMDSVWWKLTEEERKMLNSPSLDR